jgi:hypothetical protein
MDSSGSFFHAVRSKWGHVVTGAHSAPFWLGGLLLSVLVPLFAWDQTTGVGYKLLISAGIPSILLLTSIYVAASRAWQGERNERSKAENRIKELESRLTPRLSISLPDGGMSVYKTQSGKMSKWAQLIIKSETEEHLENCELWLKDIKRLNPDGSDMASILDEPTQCQWSQRPENEFSIQLRAKVAQRANIFKIF